MGDPQTVRGARGVSVADKAVWTRVTVRGAAGAKAAVGERLRASASVERVNLTMVLLTIIW